MPQDTLQRVSLFRTHPEKFLFATDRKYPFHGIARIGPALEVFGLFELKIEVGVTARGFEQNLTDRYIQHHIGGIKPEGGAIC